MCSHSISIAVGDEKLICSFFSFSETLFKSLKHEVQSTHTVQHKTHLSSKRPSLKKEEEKEVH